MDRWQGRVALVTGASGGIGSVICEELMKRGMTVLGVCSSDEKVSKISLRFAAEEYTGKFFGYKCDLTKEDEILTLHEKIREDKKKIQLCINCAVVIKNSSLVEGAGKDWREMLEVGVLGLCINTREAVKSMLDLIEKKEIDEGQVIQMGGIVGHKIPSLAGKPVGTPKSDLHFYAGTKFMVRGLTEGLRQELKDRKIRVSAISPGTVETALLEKASTKEEADVYFKTYKCLQPKDVADAVIYILSTPAYLNVHDIIMEPVAFQV